jgi:iron complex transport system ATP-binding protein
VIDLRHVTIAVDGRPLVRDIHARVETGEFIAVLGANGVGKTTLLRVLAGLAHAESGTVSIDGTPLSVMTPAARAKRIAFVTSDDVMSEALRVRDVVAIGRFPHHGWWEWRTTEEDEAVVAAALDAVQMTPFADRLFTTLSSGERQRVWIAMGLAQQTPVLLLDEPTSHLDVRVAHEILALLKRLAAEGRAVVCVLHDLNDAAAYADRLMLLGDERMLAFDAPDAVMRPQLIESAYGIAVERIDTTAGPRVFASITSRA